MKRKQLNVNAFIGVAALAVYSAKSQAHVFGAEGAGFAEGFVHPFVGLDHLLAMLAVGIWAAQMGQRALWRIPLAFIGIMSLAALSASYGADLPLIELIIAATVLILGIMLLFAVRLTVTAGMLVAGLFAIAHGYAHGLEMPQAASPFLYGAGFITATSLIHLLGVAMALPAKNKPWLTRTGGLAIAVAGLYLGTIAS